MIRRNSRAIAIGNDADRNGWRQRSLLISNPERYYGGRRSVISDIAPSSRSLQWGSGHHSGWM
jgi:hypothetical protein